MKNSHIKYEGRIDDAGCLNILKIKMYDDNNIVLDDIMYSIDETMHVLRHRFTMGLP